MKILEFLKQMNKKPPVKTQRLLELKKYYLSMYRIHMMYLYDKGYINDPTILDQRQIYSNIIDLGVKGMFDIAGNICLTTSQIKYAICKNKEDEICKEFVTLLYEIFRYREYCLEVDNLYEEFKFSEAGKQKIMLGLKLSGSRVDSKLCFNLSRGGLACLVSPKSTVRTVNINNSLWVLAMKELGIPEEDWYKDGLFDSDLSHTEELESIKLILDGNVNLTGIYKETLTDWLYSHKWVHSGMTNTRKGLYSYLFLKYSDDVLSSISVTLNNYKNAGENLIAFIDNELFIESPIHTYNIPFGPFTVLVSEEDALLFEGATINGYSGEAYPEEYLLEEGIPFVGCPIELYISPKEKGIFYDLEQVDVQSETWFKTEGAMWYAEDEDALDLINPFIEGTLEYTIFDLYNSSLMGKLIGKIPTVPDLEKFESAKKNVMKAI